MRLSKIAELAATLFTLAGSARLGSASAEGFYVLAEATHSKDSLNGNYFDNALGSSALAGFSSSASGRSNQLRIQGGYRFSPNWAAEVGYIDFGKANYAASYPGGNAQGTLKAGGVDAVGLALLPFDSGFTIFGKAGLVAANVKSNLANVGFNSNASAHVVRPLLGVGAMYAITKNVDLRADLDYVSNLGKSSQTGTMKATMFSLGRLQVLT